MAINSEIKRKKLRCCKGSNWYGVWEHKETVNKSDEKRCENASLFL